MKNRIVLGVTDPISLRLMRGHPTHLRNRGWDVHVATGPHASPIEGATLHTIAMRRDPSFLRDLVALVHWIRLLGQVRPGVVMVGTPKAGLLGSWAAWVVRVPRRIYLMRGLRLETAHGLLWTVLWLTERLACAFATDVVCVSPSLASRAAALRLAPASRLRVLGSGSSNGVDTREFVVPTPSQRSSSRRQLDIQPDSRVIGFVGRIHADKGIDTLVDAVGRLGLGQPVTLLLVGGVENSDLLARVRSALELSDIGAVILPHTDQIQQAYWAMDVLCLPSLREGFPNVVLEAAASGVPSIVSDATGCCDSVVEGRTGWRFSVGEAASLAEALYTALSDPGRLLRAGLAAREWVVQEFGRDLVWSRMDTLLEQSCEKGRR